MLCWNRRSVPTQQLLQLCKERSNQGIFFFSMLELLPTFPWEKKRWKSEFESFPPFKTLFFIFLFYDGTFQLFFGCFLSSFVTTHFQFTSTSVQFYFNSFSLQFPVFVQLITILVSSLVSFHINSFRFRFKVPK